MTRLTSNALVNGIVNVVLYEGYILYPYRPALKNRQRWTFGGLLPQAYCEAHGTDAWSCQTQCLVVRNTRTMLDVRVQFLHLMDRTVGEVTSPLFEWPSQEEPDLRPVEALEVGDKQYQRWQEAVERAVPLDDLLLSELCDRPERRGFTFPAQRMLEPLQSSSGEIVGVLVREQQSVEGGIALSAERVADDLFKVTVRVVNGTTLVDAAERSRDEALMRSLISTHTLLGVRDGQFVSLIDPPEAWRAFAADCRNVGAWPVLVGNEGQTDTMLSAPIILHDYPQIAGESPGDLFDGTEIDEILSLRVLTLTDEERRAAGGLDERSRQLLERTEALARDQLLRLHGTMRRGPW